MHLILASLFLNFTWAAPNVRIIRPPTEASTIKMLQKAQLIVQPKAGQCSGLSPTTEECQYLESLPYTNQQDIPFLSAKSDPICKAPLLSHQISESGLNMCKNLTQNRYSQDYKPESRSNQWKRGLRATTDVDLVNQTKINEVHDLALKKITEIKTEMKARCCRDEECENIFNRVTTSFCVPPAEMNAPDFCAKGGGSGYHFDTDKIISGMAKILREKISLISKFADGNSDVFEFLQSPKMPFSTWPVPGEIQFDPYFKIDSPNDYLVDLASAARHEFTHACDLIHAQIAVNHVTTNPDLAFLAFKRLHHQHDPKLRCKVDQQIKDYFAQFLTSIGISKALFNCVSDLQIVTDNSQSPYYCPTACPAMMIVEATAQLSEMYLLPPETKIRDFTNLVCFTGLDSQHLSKVWLNQCALQNDSSYRNRWRQNFKCSAVP